MRDRSLLAFTLLAVRQLGDDAARLVRDGRPSLRWYSGPQPLNHQAVRELLNDGWLRLVPGRGAEVRIAAWPRFADPELQASPGPVRRCRAETPCPMRGPLELARAPHVCPWLAR